MYPGYTGPVVVRGFVDLLSALDDDNDEMYFSTALVNGATGAFVTPGTCGPCIVVVWVLACQLGSAQSESWDAVALYFAVPKPWHLCTHTHARNRLQLLTVCETACNCSLCAGQGIAASSTAGVHVHEGFSCDSDSAVGGTFWDKDVDVDLATAVTPTNVVGAAAVTVAVWAFFDDR